MMTTNDDPRYEDLLAHLEDYVELRAAARAVVETWRNYMAGIATEVGVGRAVDLMDAALDVAEDADTTEASNEVHKEQES